MTKRENLVKLLGRAKALLPIWNRKIETSREMVYGEIKALLYNKVLTTINNVQSAANLIY